MRLPLLAITLLLSSCSFYKLNTYSLLDSVGKEEVKVDNWATVSYPISELNDILYIKAPVYYVSPPAALLTATCPFVEGGNDWKNWWSFPQYQQKCTSREITYMYFPLDRDAVQRINKLNHTHFTFKSYQPKPYTLGEFENQPHRLLSTGVHVFPVISVLHVPETTERVSAGHYIVKPLSYIAWGIDTVSIVPCSVTGWLLYDIPCTVYALTQ